MFGLVARPTSLALLLLAAQAGASASASGVVVNQSLDCYIKGVTNHRGEKVFYMPNEPAWKLITMKGHPNRVWICGEARAIQDGYRPAPYDNIFRE